MSDNADRIDQLLRAVAELKELLPEAHGLLRDLRTATKDARAALDSCAEAGKKAFDETMQEHVDEQLALLVGGTKEAMHQAARKVIAEFDELSRSLGVRKLRQSVHAGHLRLPPDQL